jgi:hypothetical protein
MPEMAKDSFAPAILWIVSLLLGLFQRETATFVAVISLIRQSRIEEFRGFRRSPRCFFAGITAETAAARRSSSGHRAAMARCTQTGWIIP